MSLARLRDQFRKPFRMGAHVTVTTHHGTWHGTIAGSEDDNVRVQDDTDHVVRSVHVNDIQF